MKPTSLGRVLCSLPVVIAAGLTPVAAQAIDVAPHGTSGLLVTGGVSALVRQCPAATSRDMIACGEMIALPADGEARLEARIKRALFFHGTAEVDRAAQEVSEMLTEFQENAEAWHFAARFALSIRIVGNPLTKALDEHALLGQALALAPDDADILETQAFIETRVPRKEQVDVAPGGAIRGALEAEPDQRGAMQVKMEEAAPEGKWRIMLATHDRLVEQNPNDPMMRRARGLAAIELGRFDIGASDLKHAVAAMPQDHEAVERLSFALAGLGRHAEAADQLTALLDNPSIRVPEPLRSLLLMKRGMMHHLSGNSEQAMTDIVRATAFGGPRLVLQAQVFMANEGVEAEINGRGDDVFIDALESCFERQTCWVRLGSPL